jgi:hypothetical protein
MNKRERTQPSQSTLSYKTKERRIALDGQPYTKAEFREYYKSYKEWDAAVKCDLTSRQASSTTQGESSHLGQAEHLHCVQAEHPLESSHLGQAEHLHCVEAEHLHCVEAEHLHCVEAEHLHCVQAEHPESSHLGQAEHLHCVQAEHPLQGPHQHMDVETHHDSFGICSVVKTSDGTFSHLQGDTSISQLGEFCLSKYMPGGSQAIAMRYLSTFLKPGRFVFLPHYSNKGDTQCSVTGKVKIRETPEEAAAREILEELGLHVDPKKLQKIKIPEIREEDGKTWHYFLLDDISSTCVTPSSPQGKHLRMSCAQRGKLRDNYKEKVCVFVTSPYNPATLQTIYARERLPTKATHDIAGVKIVGMRKEDLIEIVARM